MDLKTAGSSSNVLADGDALSPAATGAAVPTADAPAANADAAPAVPAVVTRATLLETLKAQREWTKAIVFDAAGTVVAATVQPLDGEMAALTKLFDKREDTIASGIILLGEQYDVHRFHPPLIYGRRGDPVQEDGEGIAVCSVDHKATGRPLYCLITYVYPTLSARAVPRLKELCEAQLVNLVL